VSLVGAGPGAADLLTARAIVRLREADTVFYDGLTSRQVLALSPRAEHVSVARRVGHKTLTQDDVIKMMVTAARAGRRVVRLKSGDPFVLGRGGEEARALLAAGIPVEVVPGVTTALAAPALSGIAVTERGVASAVAIVSGHDRASYAPVLGRLTPGSATIVVLMGLGERSGIRECLIEAGWPRTTPAALIVKASQSGERVWTGTLGSLGAHDRTTVRTDPGVIVIGEVVGRRTPSPPAVSRSGADRRDSNR
jgi:uroporphyrin-III C-methyltransferase